MERNTLKPITGLVLALPLLLSGCVGLFTKKPAEEQVRERAQAWADALLEGDLQGAYRYTSPSYRSYASVGAYHARVQGTARWDKAEVETVECPTEHLCEVTFLLEYPGLRGDGTVRRSRSYKWVESQGGWWIYVAP